MPIDADMLPPNSSFTNFPPVRPYKPTFSEKMDDLERGMDDSEWATYKTTTFMMKFAASLIGVAAIAVAAGNYLTADFDDPATTPAISRAEQFKSNATDPAVGAQKSSTYVPAPAELNKMAGPR